MSDGTDRRGTTATGAVSVDRPLRIQELRDATAEVDDAPARATTPTATATTPPTTPAPAVTHPTNGGPATGGPPSPTRAAAASSADDTRAPAGRTGLLVAGGVALAAVALVAALVLRGGSSSDPVTAAPTTVAVPTTAVVPTSAAGTPTPVVGETGPAASAAGSTGETGATTAATTTAMCAGAKVYSIDDLLQLGKNATADPDGFLAAYRALDANAPADLKPLIDQLGPLTEKAYGVVKRGEITTDVALQAWLVAAPRQELETWVAAQQALAPKLLAICAGQ